MKKIILFLVIGLLGISCSNDDKSGNKKEEQDYRALKKEYLESLNASLNGRWYIEDVEFNKNLVNEEQRQQIRELDYIQINRVVYNEQFSEMELVLHINGQSQKVNLSIRPDIDFKANSDKYEFTKFYSDVVVQRLVQDNHILNSLFDNVYEVKLIKGKLVFDNLNKQGNKAIVNMKWIR